MARKSKKDQNIRYEVVTREDKDSGDLYIPIPEPLLKQLGWKEGDDIDFKVDEQGRYIISKVKK